MSEKVHRRSSLWRMQAGRRAKKTPLLHQEITPNPTLRHTTEGEKWPWGDVVAEVILGIGTGTIIGAFVAIPVLIVVGAPFLWLLDVVPLTHPLAQVAQSCVTNNLGLLVMSLLMMPFMAVAETWLTYAWQRNRILAWSQAVTGTLIGFPTYILFSTRFNPFWQ